MIFQIAMQVLTLIMLMVMAFGYVFLACHSIYIIVIYGQPISDEVTKLGVIGGCFSMTSVLLDIAASLAQKWQKEDEE